jgi:hypothetical protein
MRRLMGAVVLLALVALASWVCAGVRTGGREAGEFICPLTGETLPCPKCCPASREGSAVFVCPLTGEPLPSPTCCPLERGV